MTLSLDLRAGFVYDKEIGTDDCLAGRKRYRVASKTRKKGGGWKTGVRGKCQMAKRRGRSASAFACFVPVAPFGGDGAGNYSPKD